MKHNRIRSHTPSVMALSSRLLEAIPLPKRSVTLSVIANPRLGGSGLRAWLALIHRDGRALPKRLSPELIDVYLTDDGAEPLHDCERCGLAVPVRAGRQCGHEATIERVYFPECPNCGGRTGRHAYWSRVIPDRSR